MIRRETIARLQPILSMTPILGPLTFENNSGVRLRATLTRLGLRLDRAIKTTATARRQSAPFEILSD